MAEQYPTVYMHHTLIALWDIQKRPVDAYGGQSVSPGIYSGQPRRHQFSPTFWKPQVENLKPLEWH